MNLRVPARSSSTVLGIPKDVGVDRLAFVLTQFVGSELFTLVLIVTMTVVEAKLHEPSFPVRLTTPRSVLDSAVFINKSYIGQHQIVNRDTK